MKAIGVLITGIFFLLFLGDEKANGQTIAVGRVFAEVVESVSAASSTITEFELAKPVGEAAGENFTPGMLDLGAITINTGKNITCNIVLAPTTLSNEEGNSFTIDPAVKSGILSASVASNGIQAIKLGATPKLENDQASGVYEGSYTVIFAYN